MRILGVDPGLRNTGVFLRDASPSRPDWLRCLHKGTLRGPRESPLLQCRRQWEQLEGVLATWRPAVMIIEEAVWMGGPRKGMLPLAMLIGGMICLAHRRGVRVVCLTPAMKRTLPAREAKRLRLRLRMTPHERDAYRLATTSLTSPSVAARTLEPGENYG